MSTVLITAIGSFSANIVIKKIKEMGNRTIGCDIYPKEWLEDAYNVNQFYQIPAVSDKEKYIETLIKICEKEKVDFIFPLIDIEVECLSDNIFEFQKRKIIVCISSNEVVKLCRNKLELSRFLFSEKIENVIESNYLKDFKDESEKIDIICKPNNGRSSNGVVVIKSKKQLDVFTQNNDISNYIYQPFIVGDIITVDVIRDEKHDKIVCIERKELLRTNNGAGISVYVFNDSKLELLCKKIAKKLKINGCINFEFILNEQNEYYFMECNPRFSGGVEFSCMAGYDCIENHLKCFSGEIICCKKEIENQFISRKYNAYVTSIEKNCGGRDKIETC